MPQPDLAPERVVVEEKQEVRVPGLELEDLHRRPSRR